MQLRVKLSKKAFIPGERVSCTVQVRQAFTPEPGPVARQQEHASALLVMNQMPLARVRAGLQ